MRKPWSRRSRGLPDAELMVLKALWERGPATVRELAEELYPPADAAGQATVQKLLDRLRERGCVSRRRRGRAHVYRARVVRDDLIRERLRDTAETLAEGSFTPLLTQLVDARRLTPDEIRTLRELVESLEDSSGEA